MFNRQQQINYYSGGMNKPPIVVCPYDAELFGHWWFEGVDWLNFVIRKSAFDQDTYQLTTPFKYLEKYPRVQVAQPCPSSWGYQGYNEVWLNGSNDWIYRHIHKSLERMTFLADRINAGSPLMERALNQAAREVMLARAVIGHL
jgi:1,4-alpha-glucan branching enzyme